MPNETPSPPPEKTFTQKVEFWKSRLLDLSRRNRLLFFKDSKYSNLKLVQPRLEEIFDRLVFQGESLTFITEDELTERERQDLLPFAEEDTFDVRAGNILAETSDGSIERVLYKLRLKAQSALEEQGVNILFVAFGFLEWTEGADGSEKVRSPLVLAPVELTRESIHRPYHLSLQDEDVILNPALAQKMKTDFDITLPELPEDIGEINLEEWFSEVEQSVADRPGWSVTSDCYLGVFSFAKLVMYKDLERNIERLKGHPIISALAGDASRLQLGKAEVIRAEELDDKVAPEDTFQVLDADPSQQEAILAAKQGVSFVLQGPPGTGKSQTITNIIGECLAAGKKVLFVSEKMAALEVVKRRLDQTGLGEFCLELHSHKASRKAVVNELGRALELHLSKDPGDGRDTLTRLTDIRKKLNQYVRALHQPRGGVKITPYHVHGELTRLKNVKDLGFSISSPLSIKKAELEKITDCIRRIAAIPGVFDNYQNHPWRDSHVTTYSFQLRSDIGNHISELRRQIDRIDEETQALMGRVGLSAPASIAGVERLVDFLSTYRLRLLTLDLNTLRDRFKNDHRSPLRWFKPAFREDLTLLKSTRRSGGFIGYHKARKVIEEASDLAESCRVDTDKPTMPEGMPSDDASETASLSRLKEYIARATEEVAFLVELLPSPRHWPGDKPIESAPFDTLRGWLEYRRESLDSLREWIQFKETWKELADLGFEHFLCEAIDKGIKASELLEVFDRRFYLAWLDEVYSQDPVLRNFNSAHHQELIDEFRALDRRQMEIAQARVREKLFDQRPDSYWVEAPSSEQTILRREIKKKRRYKPMRRLFADIPNLLLTLKPCLLMSPMSISQFLGGCDYEFDVVVFDEASQIFPEDAVGAITRGQQIIVVGDDKQLPPTPFGRATGLDETYDEELDELGVYESILDECATLQLPQRSLLWHYRSLDEALIAFSNYHFYDNALSTFPTKDPSDENLGLRFVYEPEGVYDRSKSRRNPVEARRIVDAVFEHFDKYPEQSLGVVALSKAQQECILEEIERRRRETPVYEHFFGGNQEEPFFVKNLESVQGDERDVMLLGIGYGKDQTGTLTLNFGPVNQEGGERRLNVATTRAKHRLTLFSSILPTDIDISRVQHSGVKLLRGYMEYAYRQGDPSALLPQAEASPEADFESPFEEQVCKALRSQGITLHKQVGCSRYRIDLGIVDPSHPGGYLLGIECDGAMYHSAKTARERDRLRQEILEKRGWKIHRVWSRDWFENPKREIEKILRTIESATCSKAKESPESEPS